VTIQQTASTAAFGAAFRVGTLSAGFHFVIGHQEEQER